VRLVLFTERVFPGVLEEVVLLLADGYDEGPALSPGRPQAMSAEPDPGHLRACDAWQTERCRRGEISQRPADAGNPFRPR
jgi:adenine-specific DNA-methyltransferase